VVCSYDFFCCDTLWDGVCDGEAELLCTCCPGQDPGYCIPNPPCNCCTGGYVAGCDCPSCEAKVCETDAFCCDVGWDYVCNAEAQNLCSCCANQFPGFCGLGVGSQGCNCCQGGDGVGCDDTTCEASVCAVDWFCCDIGWDSVCNEEAAEVCTCC
jgi:hypothetical protein